VDKKEWVVGVNTAMFDGIDTEAAFQTIQQAGFRYVELAYNEGYVGNISPALFSQSHAEDIKRLLNKYGLKTAALGCTMKLAAADTVEQLRMRVRFAHQIGATAMNICTGRKEYYDVIVDNLRTVAPYAAEHNCVICIENGGDPNFDAFAVAEEGFTMLQDIGHDAVAFNIDAGNMVSLRPDEDAIAQALAMLPAMRHLHIKDIEIKDGEFFFCAIGDGCLNYGPLLEQLSLRQIPCSLEIPLRMHRQQNTYPLRAQTPVDPAISLEVLIRSRLAIEKLLGHSLY